MIIECPQCSQRIDVGEEPPSSFPCPTCNGHIHLQVIAEAIKPSVAVSRSLGQGIKLPVLLGSIAGAVGLSLLVGWLIWGRSGRQSAERPYERVAGNEIAYGIELNVSEPTVVVDARNSPGKKPKQAEKKDESAKNWADHELVLKNLNQILNDAIQRSKIQVRGTDQLAYAINTVTPYSGWVKDTHIGEVVRLLRLDEGKMLLDAEWHENGQLKHWKTYHPTLRSSHGLHTKWHENGNLSGQWNYREGVLSGVTKRWYESGVQSLEVQFENDEENGLSTSWHENGNKQSEQHYKNGVLDGKSVEYHPNGQKRKEGQYKDKKMTGRWESWHDNGAKWAVWNLQDGLLTGPSESWHPNGKMSSKGAYRNNQYVGDWVRWDENGEVSEPVKGPKPINGSSREVR